jgi:hypothetical protein
VRKALIAAVHLSTFGSYHLHFREALARLCPGGRKKFNHPRALLVGELELKVSIAEADVAAIVATSS